MIPEWIAVDLSATHLQVWAMQGDTVLDRAQSANGMTKVAQDGLQPALFDLIESWLDDAPVDVIACGIVGARDGWGKTPYSAVPCAPTTVAPFRVADTDSRIRVFVVPGVKQTAPPDIINGQETQIAGFLANHQNWDGVLCLPGPHTKWVQISAGEIVSFRTFMTGEIIDLLREQSVLKHSLIGDWDDAAFAEATADALSKPEQLAARLFGLRANDLLKGQNGGVARAQLSGYLIGAELAATRPYWLGQQLAIIGAEALSDVYFKALRQQGAFVETSDNTQCTLAGLSLAFDMTRQTV